MTNPLGDLISRGEGGYNSYNRGTSNGRILGANRDIDFSQMTLAELQRRQGLPSGDPDRVFAVGKYQIIPATMSGVVERMQLDPNEQFTPALQERIFAEDLIRRKRPDIYDYITGQPGATLHAAQKAACMEWASVADPDTGRVYAPYARHGNRASIQASEVADALDRMRVDYRASVDRGVTPEDAWKAVTGQTQAMDQTRTPQTQDQLQAQSRQTDAMADGLLKQDERGPDVRGLQQSLNELGFRDARGLALVEDSDYGRRTKEAVEAFQRANGLKVDGISGPDTLARIGERLPQRGIVTVTAEITGVVASMADRNHTNHPLYRQAYDGLKQLDPQKLGFRSEQAYQNAAGTLAFEARVSGLQRIDHVIANRDGTGLFAVHGAMDDPRHHRIYVDKAQAAEQPVERSTQQLEQTFPQQIAPAQQQEREQRRGITI